VESNKSQRSNNKHFSSHKFSQRKNQDGQIYLKWETQKKLFLFRLPETIYYLLLKPKKYLFISNTHSAKRAWLFAVYVIFIEMLIKGILEHNFDIYSSVIDLHLKASSHALTRFFENGIYGISELFVGTVILGTAAIIIWSTLIYIIASQINTSITFRKVFIICSYSCVVLIPSTIPIIGPPAYWLLGVYVPSVAMHRSFDIKITSAFAIMMIVNLLPIIASIIIPIPPGATFPYFF
jgi:hypothetical protein